MAGTGDSLTAGLRKATGQDDRPEFDESKLSAHTLDFFSRYEALKGVPVPAIRKAWFTIAHLLLAPGAMVADMGCGNGQITYVMAVLNPHINFIGIDSDRKQIARTKQKYQRPNLEYRMGDITKNEGIAEGSLDAVINSFILHEIYSTSKYHDRSVVNALEHHFSLLKPEGMMFVRDYPMPAPGDMVLMEVPDKKSAGADVASLSEPDLLIWYSERARPRQDPSCHGFFLEELPPRFPNTRLFRLPYKWVYEFITRKDDRARFEADLHKEFAFFTKRESRKNLRAMGARVLYSSPHWDDAEIKDKFDGHFRLYKDDGTPMGTPPTSFIAVAQKMGEGRSLRLLERRPSNKQEAKMKVTAMRNERDGRIVDVVARDFSVTNIIPYRINEHGELIIFLHEGAPRGITNTVQRSGKNLDEKYWSGHMMEAISVNSDLVATVPLGDVKAAVHFARDHLGMKPASGAVLEKGPGFYPAPDFIEDHIGTRYIAVEGVSGRIELKHILNDIEGFTTKGHIREIGAQAVLNAITVGYIPSARLEVQLIALFEKLGMKAETWDDCPLTLKQEDPEDLFDGAAFAKMLTEEDKRYKPARGTAGQLRTVQSTFVDEGWVDGGLSGLGARDMEFVISDENTVNKAVVLPLTRTANGTVMAGITTEYMPVPQKFQGNGLIIRAPSFDLPKEITNLHQARKFIADKFQVKPENVFRLGESYFCHPGITPLRVFPFAVAAHKISFKTLGGPCQFAPMAYIWNIIGKVLDWNCDEQFIGAITKAYRYLSDQNDLTLKMDFGQQMMYGMLTPGPEKMEDMTGLAATKASLSAEKPGGNADIGIGSMGGGASGTASEQKQPPQLQQQQTVVQYRSEPVFVNTEEEFVESAHGRDEANSRLEDKKRAAAKAGT